MNLLKSIIIAAATTLALSASAKLNDLPVDPDLRIGSLPNGLTYYIRHNETPAQRADFFIAMNVGSVNEEENQRGLAHFLEHMCFNGSKHFPGNSLIKYLESIGVKFGANLNAYTSTDETVYNICEVPTVRTSAIDSCLLILRDWSGDLTLDPAEIDAERGVIKGEWRQRNGQASTRLLEKAMPQLYPGSIYGQRMPIGLMSIVENFKPAELRDYYAKWYHPANQCLIIVGDIDPDHIEAEIKRLWADAIVSPNAAISTRQSIPTNASPIVSIQSDPEQSTTNLQLYLKHSSVADSLANTIESLRFDATASLVGTMMADRFTELEEEDNSPVTNIAVGDINYLLCRGQRAFAVRAPIKNHRAAEALGKIATEIKRAAYKGFLPTELDRAKIDLRVDEDNKFRARTSTTNTDYARRYVRHYLDGGPLPSATQRHKMMRGVINGITLDDVNRFAASLVNPNDANAVILSYTPDSEKSNITSNHLLAAYTAVDPATLEPWVDHAITGSILEDEPKAGSIVATDTLPQFNAKVMTLSNGIKVYLRPDSSNLNSILIQGYSPGGFSQSYNPQLGPDYKMTNDILAVSGYGRYTSTELRRLLVGKNLRSAVTIDNMEETVGASCTPESLLEAMQMIYLRSTGARRDDRAYASLIDNTRTRLKGHDTNPTFTMGDSIHTYVYNHHPLGKKITAEGLDLIDYDRVLSLYHERFDDMTDFSFFITGNFNIDTITPLIERYIASLPGGGRIEKPRDIGYRYTPGRFHRRFTQPMENPQTIAYTLFHQPCDYNLRNVVIGHALGQIAQSKLRDEIREKRGWTYGVKSHIGIGAGMNGDDPANMIMPVYIRVAPENADSTFAIVAQTIQSLANIENITQDQLASVKAYMAKNYADNSDTGAYWITVMHMYEKFQQDMHTDYLDILQSITPADLAKFAADYLLPANRLQLEMSPQNH